MTFADAPCFVFALCTPGGVVPPYPGLPICHHAVVMTLNIRWQFLVRPIVGFLKNFAPSPIRLIRLIRRVALSVLPQNL